MKKAKFRAWFVPTERMHIGVNVINTSDGSVVLDKYEGDNRDRCKLRFYSPVDDECILMQFTGIKDKNGREIYEGDIVHWNHGADEGDQGIAAVEFRAGAFCLTGPARYTLQVFCRPSGDEVADEVVAKDIEVLGDIYQNPELLPRAKPPLSSLQPGDRKRRSRAS